MKQIIVDKGAKAVVVDQHFNPAPPAVVSAMIGTGMLGSSIIPDLGMKIADVAVGEGASVPVYQVHRANVKVIV